MHRVQPVRLGLLLSLAVALLLPTAAPATRVQAHGSSHISVLTRSYDTARTGANLQETLLDTTNVKPATFGKLFSRTVDGQIYAQPLYLPELAMPDGETHNVVFAATEKNNVYAFDADDPAAAMPLWQVNLGQYGIDSTQEYGTRYIKNGIYIFGDITPYVGITGTPVIDASTATLYVVSFVRAGSAKPYSYSHYLHALDLHTGAEKLGGPMLISAALPGTAKDKDASGNIVFKSVKQLQRPALLLLNGTVYVAFAGYADTDPYHGWVLGYDAATLQQTYVFNTTPDNDPASGSQPDANDGEGGIWMSGQGLATDAAGDIYFVTGNGNFNAGATQGSGRNYGESVLRVRPATTGTTLDVQAYFTPHNYKSLNNSDADLGVTGAMLIPDTNLVLAGSKEGKLYLLDRTAMGGVGASNDSQIKQTFLATAALGDHIHGSPTYWNGASDIYVYLWSEKDVLRAFKFNPVTQLFQTTAAMTGADQLPNGMPGGIVSLSSNGNTAGSGIVWTTTPTGDANAGTKPGVLRAYNAETLGSAIWSSATNPSRDSLGNFAKFNPPVVADGKLFVGSFYDPAQSPLNTTSDQLVVYGLLKPALVEPLLGTGITYGETATLDLTATGAGPLAYQWYQGDTGDTTTPITGATTRSFTTPQIGADTSYWVRVTNIYGSVDSTTATVQVARVTTTLGLNAAPVPSSYGQQMLLMAHVAVVAPGAGTPTGSVIFREGATTLGTAALDVAGNATLAMATLVVGNHAVTADYSGDTYFTQSGPIGANLTVQKAATSITLALSSSTTQLGAAVTFTARVVVAAPGAGTPTGNVTFREGSTVLGTAALDASGNATLAVATLAVGNHIATADYAGDSGFVDSGSLQATLNIAPGATKSIITTIALPMLTN